MSGWILLHKKIIKNWLNKDPYFRAFCIMLMEVNYEDKKVEIDGKLYNCKRGQSLNSIQTWVEAFGRPWSRQKVRTFFKLLEGDGIINQQGMRKTTILTICNYDKYQVRQPTANQQTNQQPTNSQPTDNHNINNNKEIKERKEERKEFIVPPKLEWVRDYIRHNCYHVNAKKFFNHYSANGWVRGKSKIRDWTAVLNIWEDQEDKPKNNKNFSVADYEKEMGIEDPIKMREKIGKTKNG